MKAFIKTIWGMAVCVGLWNLLAPKNLCWLAPSVIPASLLIFVALSVLNIIIWAEDCEMKNQKRVF